MLRRVTPCCSACCCAACLFTSLLGDLSIEQVMRWYSRACEVPDDYGRKRRKTSRERRGWRCPKMVKKRLAGERRKGKEKGRQRDLKKRKKVRPEGHVPHAPPFFLFSFFYFIFYFIFNLAFLFLGIRMRIGGHGI